MPNIVLVMLLSKLVVAVRQVAEIIYDRIRFEIVKNGCIPLALFCPTIEIVGYV